VGSPRIRRLFRASCSGAVCNDVLGVAAIAGQQVCGAQQSGRRIAHELVEVAAQYIHPPASYDTVSKEKGLQGHRGLSSCCSPANRARIGNNLRLLKLCLRP
jgi:hypothetical protein